MKSMGQALEWAATIHGEKAAIIDGEKRITYRHLNDRVNRLANAFKELGIKENDRLSILLYNCSEYIEIYLALAKSGIAAVPLNFRFVESEIEYVVNHSDAKALIYGTEFLSTIGNLKNKLGIKSDLYIALGSDVPSGVKSYESILIDSSADEVHKDIDLDGCYFQGYTAGTTGFPKGCVNSHSGFVGHHTRCLILYKINVNDTQLVAAPLFHEAPTLFSLMQIFIGGTIVIIRNPTPEVILSTIQSQRVTNFFMVPTMYSSIVDFPGRDKFDVSSVKTCICAGAPLLTDTKMAVLEFFNRGGLNEFYGGTEVGVVTNLYPHEQTDLPRSVGKPISGWQVKLLDASGNEVPTGTEGEIFMKGPRLLSRYYKNPEATSDAVRGEYFSLGDVGRLDANGYLYILDRKHDMIISGGENIFPIEIEEVINRHPLVNQVVVIGAPDRKWGEAVTAVVVLKQGASCSAEDIVQFCKGKLAGYKIPKSVDFRDSLPMSSFGKILKRVLRDEYWKELKRRV
jgi:acyl-CoA synthetase (AMP-forming)/AMP-acid ligase II